MKKLILLLAISTLFLSCETKKTPEITTTKNNKIVFGHKDIIHSTILDEDREIWIHLPEDTNNSSSTKYPVVYLLDGDAHFYSVTGMIKQLSTINGNTVVPEMIVVGITNTDRARDLTPTHVKEVFGDTVFSKTSGGGKNFLKFIEKELMPHIEKSYPTSNYKTFIGHSLGGLTVIDALIDHRNLFNNYIAIDPSLWWDNQKLLKKATEELRKTKYNGKSLYVGIANTMDEGMLFQDVEKDTSEETEHIRAILKFSKTAESITGNGLNFKWKYYNNDSHGSVPLITEYDAFRFLFPWYELKGLDIFFDPNTAQSTENLMNLIESHYNKVSTEFGYEVLPPESFINGLGYSFVGNSDTHDWATALFQMNIQNYPNSTNVYDSMGDCYLAQQDSIKALELFKKALAVGDNDFSQDKIDMLKRELGIE